MINPDDDHDTDPEYVTELVLAAQGKHDFSQRALAEAIGVKRQALLNWMHRTSAPTPIPFTVLVFLEYLAGRRSISKLRAKR